MSPLHSAPGARPQAQLWSTLAGLSLSAAAITINIFYGLAKAPDDPIMQGVWAVVGAATSVGLTVSIWSAIRHRTKSAIVATILLGAYSLSAALGAANGPRMDAQIAHQEAQAAISRAQATHTTTTAEIATLGHARGSAELNPLIASS